MKYPIFEKIILLMQKNSNDVRSAYRLGVDLTEINDPLHEIITHLFGSYYGQEGLDWIDWWCYEKDFGTKEKIQAWDKDGNEICRNIYELWELTEECKEAASNYELKKPMSDAERSAIIDSFFKSI